MNIQKIIRNQKYKEWFLIKYIAIGIASIIFELICYNLLLPIFKSKTSILISMCISIALAFLLNLKYNFKIPRRRVYTAFCYFVSISAISGLSNKYLQETLNLSALPYELKRVIVSAILFLFFYILHKKLTFGDYKEVGVAVYATNEENIDKIYKKIDNYADFIHIDIVDSSFSSQATGPSLQAYHKIINYWKGLPVHVHLMTKFPEKYIEKIAPNANIIFIHAEYIDIKFLDVGRKENKKQKIGAVVTNQNFHSLSRCIMNEIDYFLILSIDTPGYSGQQFNDQTYDLINNLKEAKGPSAKVYVDGGIKNTVARKLSVNGVVSSSYVLNSPDSMKTIFDLRSSSKYEK